MSERKPRPRIAVVLEAYMSCYRELIRGINSFSSTKGNWHLDLVSPSDDYRQKIRNLRPDGLIFCLTTTLQDVQAIRGMCPQCIGICGQHWSLGISDLAEVESDDLLVGETAANYFIAKGFTNFAFVGTPDAWSNSRRIGFEKTLQAAGQSAFIYTKPYGESYTRSQMDRSSSVIAWITSLPKPLAVFACNDFQGREIVETCGDEGVSVPDEVAVLGVDNDDLDCELAHPPLSSIAVPWQRLGFQAADLLHQGLAGNAIEKRVYAFPPVGVIERQSTDTIAISDPEVVAAVRFIRENARLQFGVDDVLKSIPASRRSLEKRFRAILGRSPLEEIRRVRVELAKQLLAKTDIPMPDIAENSGFHSAAWMSRTFRQVVGETPISYRKRYRHK